MNYTDLYLRADALEDLADLIDLEDFSGYYENELFVLDWIGRIPAETDEEGNVASWVDGEHFNVYAKPGNEQEVNLLFNHFEKAFPYTPYRKLAKSNMEVEMPVVPFELVYENVNKFGIEKIVGPFGEENDLKVEVFYQLRRTGEEYKIKDIEASSEIMPYNLAPGLDVITIFNRVKEGTATEVEYGIINSILQQFNERIQVVT